MVSFSCENCGDILKKPKLDQHAGRCRGAVFTCIDCNTTFQGTSYRAHTSCVSEEQRYHKSVYKPPKGKGQKGQKQQQPAAPEPAPTPETAAPAATTPEDSKKRAREDDEPSKAAEPAAAPAKAEVKDEPETAAEEPKRKKSKKDKKKDKKASGEADGEAAADGGEAKKAEEGESLSSFLSAVVSPLLAADSLSLSQLREKVLAAAKEKGRKEEQGELEAKLWEGLKVGGKKQKVKAEFA